MNTQALLFMFCGFLVSGGAVASAPAPASLDYNLEGGASQGGAPQSPEADAFLTKIETYLNGLRTLKAAFKQRNPDGSVQQGLFFLSRPGKMRLKYLPPSNQVIISDGHFLIFHNPDLDEITHIPLDSTPAELLVKENIRLREDALILGTQLSEASFTVTLARKADPEAGVLTFVFCREPMALKEWILVDQNQNVTHVFLENIEHNVQVSPALFIGPS